MARVYRFKGKFGSNGSGDGQFSGAKRIAVDANYIYVADSGNHRIQIFNKTTYAFVGKFGSLGAGNSNFNDPCGIDVDSNYIYVVDNQNEKIKIFNKNTYAYVNSFTLVPGWGGFFRAVKVNSTHIYWQKVEGTTTYLYKNDINTLVNVASVSQGGMATEDLGINLSYLYHLGSGGTTPGVHLRSLTDLSSQGSFNPSSCTGIVMDSNYFYLVQPGNSRVVVHDLFTHAFVEYFGSVGAGDGQFTSPNFIAYHSGEIFVNDAGNNRIQVFDYVYATPPAAPSDLTLACANPRSVILNWTDNS